jgi:hypothetical protein
MSKQSQPHVVHPSTRREFLETSGLGFGALALSLMMEEESLAAKARLAHHVARAKSVIWCFLEGGPSHLDLVDPKPLLNKLAGQPLPEGFKEPITAMGEKGAPLLKAPRKWTQHGESGLWASEWIPHIGSCMDDIAVIRSCHTDGINHAGGVCQMNTCINFAGRPSLGSWVNFGLGTANRNLPSFVVMCDNAGRPVNGPRNWGSGFMPATYQGVRIDGTSDEPIAHLNPPKGFSDQRQKEKLTLLQKFNREHAQSARTQQSELEARIESYELAFRMQAQAPEAVDLSEGNRSHPKALRVRSKGHPGLRAELSPGPPARRAGRQVHVQLYSGHRQQVGFPHGASKRIIPGFANPWTSRSRASIKDLKQRGLLDETLVIWGGEFGRTPDERKRQRPRPQPHGVFDLDGGRRRQRRPRQSGPPTNSGCMRSKTTCTSETSTLRFWALLGLDNMKLTYNHKGRPERPTINEGVPSIKKLIG